MTDHELKTWPMFFDAVERGDKTFEIGMSDVGCDDDYLRHIWRQAGGSFHGPLVEHGTMPEEKLLPFLRSVCSVRSEYDKAIAERFAQGDYWHNRYLDSERHAGMARIERDEAIAELNAIRREPDRT